MDPVRPKIQGMLKAISRSRTAETRILTVHPHPGHTVGTLHGPLHHNAARADKGPGRRTFKAEPGCLARSRRLSDKGHPQREPHRGQQKGKVEKLRVPHKQHKHLNEQFSLSY